jgi:hypothetical protein
MAALHEQGLIELMADGWQATAAGRSVYVVRDDRRSLHPEKEG